MTAIAKALAGIPAAAERLDADDDFLRQTIRLVEATLNDIAPGMVTTFRYPYPRDKSLWAVLTFEPARQRWIITWRIEGGSQEATTPLLSASRQARAEVFMPTLASLSPIEHLILQVADNLAETTIDRGPAIAVAKRLSSVLQSSGYTIGA